MSKRFYFWRLPDSLIRLLNMTVSMHGKCGSYIFQSSHGGRQVKLYEPHKYRNHVNTPLRKRTRDIWKFAYSNPYPTLNDRIRELYRTYPFYLLKSEPINLKLKNFYFDEEPAPGTPLKIYSLSGEQPDPDGDELYAEIEYLQERKIYFEFRCSESEKFYGLNCRNGALSNVLHFYWK